MALSSWNALYTHIEQKFMRKRQWKQLHLLKVFVQHADPFGLSYPGFDLIKDLTGIGTMAQLNEYMQWLVDGEYVKVWETYNQRRRTWDLDYQVSPFVMYIREELQGYAERIWITGVRDFGLEDEIVIKRNGQPSSEPESEPTSVNQHQNHHHHPANIAAKQLTTIPGDDYETQPAPPKQNRRKPTAGKARATEKENPQAGGRPPVPDKIDLRKYQSPLPQMSQEDLAQDLQLMFRMKISQARGLVANYGIDLIGTAAAAVQDAMNKGAVTNPPGLLTYFLKRGAIGSEDQKIYPTPAQEIAAETARWTYQDNENLNDQEV